MSASEHSFLTAGIAHDFRSDGRHRLDFRSLLVETGEKVLANTNGAASVTLGFDSATQVFVGVRLVAGMTSDTAKNSGQIACSVDWFVFGCVFGV